MREDVAGTEILREQLGDRPHAGAAEIDHDRNVGDLADFHGARKRLPFRTGIVRALDADDQPLVLQRHVGGRLDFLIREVLFVLPSGAAAPDDVDERQDRVSATDR